MKHLHQKATGILLLASAFLLISCKNSAQEMGQVQEPQPFPVLNLQPRTIALTSSYPATLEGKQTIEVRPRVQGYIVEMPVDEGDVVEKGELLFKLNSEQYEQAVRSAKADVAAAKAAINTAEDEVQRYQKLVDQNIVSNYQLQSARNKLQSQHAALAQSEAALKNAQVNLGYTNIKSPTDGVIGSIPYRIGSLVSSNIAQPLTVISDISEIYAYFSMSERELLEMAQSVAAEGKHRTLQQQIAAMPKANLILPDNSNYNHQGSIRLASGLIDSQTGSASFRATFPNPQQILRSGGSANVQIPFKQDSAIIIPKQSTFEIQNKRFVYTLTDSNTVESTEISVLPLSTKKLFVVENGLSKGDTIVSSGTLQLDDGAPIIPKPVDADSLYQSLTVTD